MINTKATGTYSLSLDGGLTFKDTANMLLTGFYAVAGGALTCVLGTSNTPPAFTDTNITNQVSSAAGTAISTSYLYDAVTEEIVVTKVTEFIFGTGITLNANEVGLKQGGTLASRALFTEDEILATVEIDPTDHVVLRYTLVTRIDSSPIPVSLMIDEVEVTGTLMAVNPNKWISNFGTLDLGSLYISLVTGSYVKGAEGYLTGSGTLVNAYAAAKSNTQGAAIKQTTYTVSTGLNATETTFNTILLTSDSNSTTAVQVVAIVTMDAPVVRSDSLVLNASFVLGQEAA